MMSTSKVPDLVCRPFMEIQSEELGQRRGRLFIMHANNTVDNIDSEQIMILLLICRVMGSAQHD